MIVVYWNKDEILICPVTHEKDLIKGWFDKDTGRDVDDYNRIESEEEHDHIIELNTKIEAFA